MSFVPLDWDFSKPMITVKGWTEEDYRRLAEVVLKELEKRRV